MGNWLSQVDKGHENCFFMVFKCGETDISKLAFYELKGYMVY